ncbi:hypothetical protein DL766_001382 [Monosporascus sp. MC13-8B]|uniref:Pentatricopeptide repeat domain-containing protein n=1 Tax=Monosporascus cannonballus TaxID=155416 RepID=A0ABY0HH39_9PEZI|nr:hypothetical protein DL762_001211 [Monosporascus cannonballus]RYP37733.1 hypothetical protein DL766_001382 [Monosporascus sp. MC13-8B]
MWPRAAQVQSSCRCRLCSCAANTLVRRSTTAAPRRRVSPADIFTACYTTILGTATIIDAHRKDAKRKELDDKLEKAKAALSTVAIQGGASSQQPQENGGASGSVSNRRNKRPVARRKNEKNTSPLLRELASMCEITRSPSGRSSWMQDQLHWVKVEATIAAEENDPECVLREPKSAKQLGKTTNTILRLVDGLLGQHHIHYGGAGRDHGGAGRQLTKAEEDVLRELEEIRTGNYYPSYEQPTSNPEKAKSIRSLLNDSLRRIFNQASSSTEIVGRICCNLLTSSYPPTIHTYNALIAGFNRILRPDLAQVVIDSYIHQTAWPATQQTMVCLLDHYRGNSDMRGLRDVIARMRGVRDTGLHFCIIPKDKVYSQDWLAWASVHCASRKNAFVERAHRGSEVFDSIIRGWLHHGNVSAASMIFVACVRHGSWIPIQTLHRLFTACLAAVDHSTARQMMKGIIKHLRNFILLIDRTLRQSTAAMSLKIIDSLSKVIHICGLPLHSASDVVGDAYARSIERLQYLVSTMKIQLELRATARLSSKVSDTIKSTGPLLTRLDAAIKIIDASHWDRKAFQSYDTVARLLSIDKRYQDLERKGKVLANQAKAIVIKMATGLDFGSDFLLASERHENPRQQDRCLAVANALERLQPDADQLTQSCIKAQLIQNVPNPHLARRLRLAGRWEGMSPKVLTSFYTPGAVAFPRPQNSEYSSSIRKVERGLTDTEDFVRALLFSYLGQERQKRLRYLYPHWYAMPLEPLVDYHLRRQPRAPKTWTKQRAEQDVETEKHNENLLAQPTRVIEGLTDDSRALVQSAIGHREIDRQLTLTGPVEVTRLPDRHLRAEGDSALRLAARG